MEWLVQLRDKVIALDTAPVIYLNEESRAYLHTVRPFFEALDRGEFTCVTSMVTLLEVLVHPFRQGDSALAQQYREILLHAEGLKTVPVSVSIAQEAARLRAMQTSARQTRSSWPRH